MTSRNPSNNVKRFVFNLDAKHYDPDAMIVMQRDEFNDVVLELETAKKKERCYWYVQCLRFAIILIKSKHPIEHADELGCTFMAQEYIQQVKREKAATYMKKRYKVQS